MNDHSTRNMMHDRQPSLAPEISALLNTLRARIRLYVWLQGIGLTLATLGVGFWLTVLVDWTFEPIPAVRIAVVALALSAVAFVAFRWIAARTWVRLSDRSLAVVLERRFPNLHDSLLTTVELTGREPAAEPVDASLLAATGAEAQRRIESLDLDDVFNAAPLTAAISAALLVAITVLIYAVLAPSEIGVWARRNLLLSAEPWPRNTHLSIEGFEHGTTKVARGADLRVVALADTSFEVPQVVEIRYRTADGARGSLNMSREGEALPPRDPYQQFAHKFQSILSPIEFDVVGGDDRIRGLRVQVVESPAISQMWLDCQFPTYTGRPSRRLPVTGLMQLPVGSHVTVVAQANKSLVAVTLDEPTAEGQAVPRDVPLDTANPTQFTVDLGTLARDRSLLFSLHDTDGIASREPLRLNLVATPDTPPTLGVRLAGIGTAITPQARLPITGQVNDDYGIERIWYEVQLDETAPRQFPLQSANGLAEIPLDTAFEVDQLQPQPGSRLAFALKALDRYALGDEPHTGLSERFSLEVVTPEELRSRLESRELNLRRRFEQIIEEVTATRQSLAEQVPPVDAPRDDEASASDESLAPSERMVVQLERALQNSQKNAGETRGVGVSFDEIYAELVNNRVDVEELKSRLKEGIADPLKRIADDRFPELVRRLKAAQDAAREPQQSPPNLAAVLQQSDTILIEMQRVLDTMVELETFNEVVALLRAIVEEQEDLNQQTQRRRRQNVRELLED